MAFDPTTTEMDSVLIALKAGGDMESVANARNAQVYNQWFVEAMALNNESVKTLVDRIFAETGSNYFTVETFAGNYIVQVLNRTKPVKKVKVAILSKTLMPSEKTNTNYYNQLSAYVAEHGDAETFVSGAKEAGFFVREADCVAELAMLPNLPGTREIIRWAFDSKAGIVSEIYTIGNNEAFVVAALENVVKEGYIPFEDAKEFLTQRVLPAKKAEKIIADLNAKELTSLEAYAQAMNTQVGNAQFITFNTPSIQGVGVEPALNGLIFNAEQGKLVGPVQGRDGVYVFTVTNKTESQEPFNAEAEAQSVQAVYNNALQQVVNVLYNKADISNKTYRFF